MLGVCMRGRYVEDGAYSEENGLNNVLRSSSIVIEIILCDFCPFILFLCGLMTHRNLEC